MYIYSIAVILYYGYNHLIQYDPTVRTFVLYSVIPLYKDTSVIRTHTTQQHCKDQRVYATMQYDITSSIKYKHYNTPYIPTCTCTHRYMYVILHALVQEPILRESMKLLAMVQVD